MEFGNDVSWLLSRVSLSKRAMRTIFTISQSGEKNAVLSQIDQTSDAIRNRGYPITAEIEPIRKCN